MRILFIITCLANIAFAFGTLPWMPEKVAVHFYPDGTPNGWEPRFPSAMLTSIIAALVGAGILGASLLMEMAAKHLPEQFNKGLNHDHRLSDEEILKRVRRFCSYLEFIGIAVMLFFLCGNWEIFCANQRVPVTLASSNVNTVGVGLLVFFAIETIHLIWTFCWFARERHSREGGNLEG